MGIVITSQFELRNEQFNFKRDFYNSLDELYAAPLTDFPDFFLTNVKGVLYMLDKSKAEEGKTDEENAKLCWTTFSNPDTAKDISELKEKVENIENQLDGLATVYKYKGSVEKVTDLPTTNLTVGDVYNVETAGIIESADIQVGSVKVNAGDNVAWTGSYWDVLAGTVDLTGYYTKTDADNKFLDKTAVAVEAQKVSHKFKVGGYNLQTDETDYIEYDGSENISVESIYEEDIDNMFNN